MLIKLPLIKVNQFLSRLIACLFPSKISIGIMKTKSIFRKHFKLTSFDSQLWCLTFSALIVYKISYKNLFLFLTNKLADRIN